MFTDKTLLITGGTGSFGHAVVTRFLRTAIAEIRVFSRDEKKQDDMRRAFKSDKLRFYLGDVRDPASVRDAVAGADYIFHAAALKQVPSCEFYPMEAVRTNVLGADNVLSAAIDAGVGKVIVLSTDKAAYPINAMGMSKALMEKVATARARVAARRGTVFCVTRYGNVMGSRGSVIPLFCDQIRRGEALTVTDPRMTRFMMTLDGAIDLVLYAFEHGAPGDLFVQKAPAATMQTLAQALLLVAGADQRAIRVIGTRHGEKLCETLLTREERAHADDLGEYFRVAPDNRDLNYDIYFSQGEESVSAMDDYNSHNTRRLTLEEMCTMLEPLDVVRDARR